MAVFVTVLEWKKSLTVSLMNSVRLWYGTVACSACQSNDHRRNDADKRTYLHTAFFFSSQKGASLVCRWDLLPGQCCERLVLLCLSPWGNFRIFFSCTTLQMRIHRYIVKPNDRQVALDYTVTKYLTDYVPGLTCGNHEAITLQASHPCSLQTRDAW